MIRKENRIRGMLLSVLILASFAMLSGCGTGGLNDPPAAAGGTGTGTGTGTGSGTAKGAIAVSFTKVSDGSATTSVSADSPTTLTATAQDSTGAAITGQVMSFSTTSDLSFNPASGQALTDAGGRASLTVKAGNTTGAVTIKAEITDAAGTAITKNAGLSVVPPNLSLSAVTVTPATLSAGGSAAVSVTVLDSAGNPYATSVPVSFTSNGAQLATPKAAITSQAYTVTGVASATYRDINYGAVDTITATLSLGGTTFTKTGTVTVNKADAGSISFVSATPANIALRGTGGTGRSETSEVKFKVLDTNGNPINKKVNFSLTANTTVGGLSLTTASADSDPGTGLVKTIVQAGTASTPVRVSATIDGTAISTASDNLIVSTGIPDQKSISISASSLNIEGLDYDGVTSDVTVRLADHFNNPVPDGTAVSFRTSGVSIQPSCTTTAGACTVKFTSQSPRPASGRVRVLAYALGEESFVDVNGNGVYDPGTDTFTDMPEPFLDANESTVRDATEEFVDTNNDGLYSPGDGIFNGILRNASITGAKTIHVRDSLMIVLSGRIASSITINNGANIQLPVCTTGVAFTNTPIEVEVIVEDINGNVMPAGTTIDFSASNGTILTNIKETVYSTAQVPPTYKVQMASDATQGVGPAFTCTNAKTSGLFTVKVTTPMGTITSGSKTVND